MDYDHLVDRVREHTGLSERPVVETAIRAVTEALGALIDHTHRDELATHLPDPLAQMLRRHAPDPEAGGADFLRRVAATEHLPRGFAVEHATGVLEALGSELDPSVRNALATQLPEEMRDWVEPRRASLKGARPRREASDEHGHRLSEGRPGSEHPVSESAPPAAHRESVAQSNDPHSDTRLSSARGVMQEREHEDLAEGRPGAEHPLSESR